MSFIALIPARAASTRLPGKPLADIAGVPMVVRVAQRAAQSAATKIYIATDDIRIQHAVQKHGFQALLTRADHLTGTDRLSEAVEKLQLSNDTIIVNVQGDEPLIEPEFINAVAQKLQDDPLADIATCASPLTNVEALFNPNVIKVVCTADDHALYFSRAPIPWARDSLAKGQRVLTKDLPAWHHIGLYAYRVGFLRCFTLLPIGVLESVESLEQLRALEHGHKIVVHRIQQAPAAGVDTLEDLQRVRAIYVNKL